jgi:hypothetical protein
MPIGRAGQLSATFGLDYTVLCQPVIRGHPRGRLLCAYAERRAAPDDYSPPPSQRPRRSQPTRIRPDWRASRTPCRSSAGRGTATQAPAFMPSSRPIMTPIMFRGRVDGSYLGLYMVMYFRTEYFRILHRSNRDPKQAATSSSSQARSPPPRPRQCGYGQVDQRARASARVATSDEEKRAPPMPSIIPCCRARSATRQSWKVTARLRPVCDLCR